MPRFYCPLPVCEGLELELPATAARHAQVLRMQPGDALTLFGTLDEAGQAQGGQWQAVITAMGRASVHVRAQQHEAIERELPHVAVHIACALTANERMDWLIEKATELGAASFWPLAADRSVLKLTGERAEKKRSHWQSIAQAACEQSGRNRVPHVEAVASLEKILHKINHLQKQSSNTQALWLSLQDDAQSWALWWSALAAQALPTAPSGQRRDLFVLCGPEGGWTAQEELRARAAALTPVRLGTRTLRAETAPIATLAALALWGQS